MVRNLRSGSCERFGDVWSGNDKEDRYLNLASAEIFHSIFWEKLSMLEIKQTVLFVPLLFGVYSLAMGEGTLASAQAGAALSQQQPVVQGPTSSQNSGTNDQGKSGLGSGGTQNLNNKDTTNNSCYQARPLLGDLAPLGLENWSVGTTIATSVVRYDFSSKKAALATGAGAGIAIRYYGKTFLGDKRDQDGDLKRKRFSPEALELIKEQYGNTYGMRENKNGVTVPLASIAPECRANSSDIGKARTEKLASSLFSIIPIVYYSKQTADTDLNVQPALMVGFLDDIVSIGTGFNLTGQEKGKMFLLLSLGYGFKF